jgi:hypothetical protein
MLTPLDDQLLHQTADTFDHAASSDPRFYDRHWFAIYNPRGSGAIQFTMGAYKNMNVLDAGCVVIRGDRQYNLRASRTLRPNFETICSPLALEMRRPLEAFDLIISQGPHGVHGQLEWRAVMLPEEEPRHFIRSRGRVTEDYCRFNQIGVCRGTLTVDGEQLVVDDWWACRDHSWGVRPRMGIREPVTGPAQSLDKAGFLMAFLFFSTTTLAGHVQIMERGENRFYQSGLMRERNLEAAEILADNVEIDLNLVPGTRRFQTVELNVQTTLGNEISLHCEARGPAIVMRGLGYSGGYRDRQGLGAWRGDHVVEYEVWGVGHAADVIDEDAKIHRPWHRLQPVFVRAAGGGYDSEGFGSITMLASGKLVKYGLLND